MNVGGLVEMNITFLSPITPDDLKRQSLVSSYLHVEVTSIDGASHDVQLYADIAADWVSGDTDAIAQWDYGVADGVAYHKVYRQTQLLFSEIGDRAEWGYWYWATDHQNSTRYQSGSADDVRNMFSATGELANSEDTTYRAISDNYPVFAFSIDLGAVDPSPVRSLFSIGLAQTDAIQYATKSGTIAVQSAWTSYFPDDVAALTFFHKDYSQSSSLSAQFDAQVARDSIAAGGQNYLTITSLSVRQAFGSVQICGSRDKTYAFMKEISSDGNMNTVDVIFPAHPILLYTNPTFLKLLLDPLFEYQESSLYPNSWAMHDLGAHYPNATGHPDGKDEPMPLEECGNMIIMALAYALRAQDTGYLEQHYSLLKKWIQYLAVESLYPANQISTDDFAGSLANQTNLALKGIIGIEAMSVISRLTGNEADSANYTAIAHDYIDKWQTLGIAHDADPPHTTLSYGENDTHGLLYNLYADTQLQLHLVPQSVYDMQSNFYPTAAQKYGVPLDTRHTYTKGDWEMFVAAIASGDTRNTFIKDLATWINDSPTNFPLTDLYDTITGDYPDSSLVFKARPVMGGSFALLLLN